jgi:hypothetical protein
MSSNQSLSHEPITWLENDAVTMPIYPMHYACWHTILRWNLKFLKNNVKLSESPGGKVSINTHGSISSIDVHWFELSAILIERVDETEGRFLLLSRTNGAGLDSKTAEEMARARVLSWEIPIDVALELLGPAQAYMGRYWKESCWRVQQGGKVDKIDTGRLALLEWGQKICEFPLSEMANCRRQRFVSSLVCGHGGRRFFIHRKGFGLLVLI